MWSTWSKFFTKKRGFDSYLPYIGFVNNGVIFLKSGGFSTVYEIRGRDLSSSTEYELGQVSNMVNASLMKLGDGWITHVDTIRTQVTYYPSESECYFPDPVTRLIDTSRRQTFESNGLCFENKYYLTLTYTPPSILTKKMNFIFEAEDKQAKHNSSVMDKELIKFEDSINRFFNIFDAVIYTRKLSDEETLTYLHFCITGLRHKVSLPIIPMYIDYILASKDFIGGFKPKIGNKKIKIITIKSFPSYLHTGILDALNNMSFEFRFNSRFIFLDQATSRKFIEDKRKDWDESKTSFKAIMNDKLGSTTSTTYLSTDAISMANDADRAVNENQKNEISFGFYSSSIVLMDEDEENIENNSKEIIRILENLRFPCTVECVNAVEAYLGSIPAVAYANVRKPLISTHNLSHIMPLTAAWSGEAEHPNPKYNNKNTGQPAPPMFYAASYGRTPFRCSLHVKDVGHTLMIGSTGSGKTALLAFIAAQQFRYKNSRVFVFDKLCSQYVLCNAVGGSFFELSANKDNEKDIILGKNISFCPLADIDDINGRSWAEEWISSIVSLQHNRPISIEEQTSISDVLTLMTKETNKSCERKLSKFVSQVQNYAVKQALEPYVDINRYGHMFDGSEDFITESRFCVFEMNDLMDKGEQILIPALTYMFRKIEKSLDGSPTLLILDEAWTYFKHEVFSKKIEKWLRELRRQNCAVVFATQSVNEIYKSEIVSVILESCKTKIYLPNHLASKKNPMTYEIYQSFGLNEKQIDIIANAQPKRHYYLSSESGNKLFEILFDSLTLSFVGVADKEDINNAREFIKKYKNKWISEWLKFKNVTQDWIDYFEVIQSQMPNKTY